MAKEIERKFLVKDRSFIGQGPSVSVRQGYIFSEKGKTVRVRIQDDKAFLTIKGRLDGITRNEFEYRIDSMDARQMLDLLCEGSIIEKRRHLVKFEGHLWEVDEFLGENEGLVIAEIELKREDEEFKPPAWVSEEVTQDLRYYNSFLSKHPFKGWQKDVSDL